MNLQSNNLNSVCELKDNFEQDGNLFFNEEKVSSKVENVVVTDKTDFSTEFEDKNKTKASDKILNDVKNVKSNKRRNDDDDDEDLLTQKKLKIAKNVHCETTEKILSTSSNNNDQMNLDLIENSDETRSEKTINQNQKIENINNRCSNLLVYFDRFKKYHQLLKKNPVLSFLKNQKEIDKIPIVSIQKNNKIISRKPKNNTKLHDKVKMQQIINRNNSRWFVKIVLVDYYVTENGNIFNSKHRVVYGSKNDAGYVLVGLHKKYYSLNRIVASTFGILNETNCDFDVDHIDRNRKQDNSLSNLQVLNREQHAKKTTTDNPNRGMKIGLTLSKPIWVSSVVPLHHVYSFIIFF